MNTIVIPNTKEMLGAIGKHNSIYGKAALEHLNDEIKGPQFLREVYDEFKEFPEHCVDAFGYKTTFQLFAMFKDSSTLL